MEIKRGIVFDRALFAALRFLNVIRGQPESPSTRHPAVHNNDLHLRIGKDAGDVLRYQIIFRHNKAMEISAINKYVMQIIIIGSICYFDAK